MSRALRIAGFTLAGIVALVLLLAGIALILLNTDFGVDRIGSFLTGRIAGQVQGELRVEDYTSGGVLNSITVHGLAIDGPEGRPFLRTDSARIGYEWRTLVGGQIVLDGVVLRDPEVVIEQLPGDTAWNYERIFADTSTAPDTVDTNELVLIRDARVYSGRVLVRTPWQPDPDEPVEPNDTARMIIEPAPGGLVRIYRFEEIDAALPRILWESPVEEGKLLRIASLSTRGFYWERPFLLRDAAGTVTVRDSLISFDLPRVRLPESRLSSVGRYIAAEADRYDVRIQSEHFVFDDLQWLYPPLPEEGGGTMVLRIQTLGPERTLWLFKDAHLVAPGTELSGTLGFVTGETFYFTRVDLHADRVDLEFLEELLPGDLPVEGLEVGEVDIEGPLSVLQSRGSARLARGGDPLDRALGPGVWSGQLQRRSTRWIG